MARSGGPSAVGSQPNTNQPKEIDMDTIAPVMTMDTTWNFQWDNGDGTYSWYSQCEYISEEACRAFADSCYGGGLKYRVIKIERHVIEN